MSFLACQTSWTSHNEDLRYVRCIRSSKARKFHTLPTVAQITHGVQSRQTATSTSGSILASPWASIR